MASNFTLTARELELLNAVGKYLQTASVDWAEVAKDCNFKAPKAARDKWYPLRDKLFGASGNSNDAPKAKATSRKRKTVSDETPAKKKKAKKAASETAEDDENTAAGNFVKPEFSDEGESVLL